MTGENAPDDVNEFLDNVPPAPDPALGAAAKNAASRATSTLNTFSVISDARAHLQETEVHGRIRNFKVPPAYGDIFQIPIEGDETQRKWAVQEIEYFRDVVNQYKDGEYDPVQIETDIVRLSSNLVFFSSFVNYIDAIATHSERVRKESEMRAFLELRSWAEGQGMSVRQFGADVMKAIALEETKDTTDFQTIAQSVSATIKGFYYSLKDFISYLDRVSQRAQAERMSSRRI